jgi:nucleotide-binding universal stress UspA family protein
MKRIIVPTDFSHQADFALDFACQVAKHHHLPVELVHVIESFPHFLTRDKELKDKLQIDVLTDTAVRLADMQMDEIMRNPAYEGIKVKKHIRFGNPFQHLTKEISTEENDLVIMGTKGISGLDEVIIGSNAERMIRYAKCPVVTLKHKVDTQSVKKIVFAGNYKLLENNDFVVEEFRTFLQCFPNAKLYLLKVHTPSSWATTRYAKNHLEEFRDLHQFPNSEIQIYNDIDEENGIHNFAKDIEADVIALATHSRVGIRYVLAGGLTEGLVNHSQRLTWTVSLKK